MITPKNFWLWFGGILLVVGAPFLIVGLYLGAQHLHVNKRLDAEGRTVEGMVLTETITSTSSGSRSRRSSTPTYKVTFRFTTPGGLVNGEAEMTRDAWDALVEREAIRRAPEQMGGRRVSHRFDVRQALKTTSLRCCFGGALLYTLTRTVWGFWQA